MSRRCEIPSLAYGLLGSFVSRNNDYRGYWALGLLYARALVGNSLNVSIKLIPDADPAEDDIIRAIGARYKNWMLGAMARRSLPTHWILSADASVAFEAANVADRRLRAVGEQPFLASLKITTEWNKTCVVQASGSCWPHDPAREIRSARGD